MDEIAFNDWPGQPMDLSGSNHWLPAYGFQQLHTILDKDDFIGNPDADLFLQGNSGSHYLYLETIIEETSDDLQSDKSESCCPSPVGWLATDSESGSVIRIENLDDGDLDTERDILWPLKRRRQEPNLLGISDEESNQSLSRSSSLLQFESLERQCQDISNSSPSILSSFSFDSLETRRKNNLSPDSLEYEDGNYQESDYYKSLKIDIARPKYNSYLHNKTRSSSSESSGSPNDRSLEEYCRSNGSLKTSRSLETLQKSDKISIENLSEDSGYSDHLCNFSKYKSTSIPNLKAHNDNKTMEYDFEDVNAQSAFPTYTSDYQFENVSLKFGSSYQDLTMLDKYDINPLIERFMNNGKRQNTKWEFNLSQGLDAEVNIEKRAECDVRASKYNVASASEPNLLQHRSENIPVEASQSLENASENFFNNSVCVSSVPKDLNLTGDFENGRSGQWNLEFFSRDSSIAVKNWDIADFTNQRNIFEDNLNNAQCKMEMVNKNNAGFKFNGKKQDSSSISTESDIEISAFVREGSYLEAMSNRVDLSDDEYNPCYMENIRKSTIVEFDKEIFKTVSQTSIPSFRNSTDKIDFFVSTPISTNIRNVISTPNLTTIKNKQENGFEVVASCSNQNFVRKSSLVNHSASTSGLSDDEKTLVNTKSFGGSVGSKGVHFCPIVAEVNWHDSETTSDKDSSYSLSSTPECEDVHVKPPTPPIIRPQPRILTVTAQVSKSQPDLQCRKPEVNLKIQNEVQSRDTQSRAVSQPDVKESGSVKRRGSKVVRSDEDGSLLGSYVDEDGIVYRHSHLGDVYHSMPPTPSSSHVSASSGNIKIDTPQTKLLRPQQAAVPTMDSINTINGDTKPKKSKKLSGFFSRLASFRFSSRKTFDDSKNKKKSVPVANNLLTPTTQRIATKDDYIYIPLKGPEKVQSRNNQQVPAETSVVLTSEDAACISAKPPLPKAPPRVVGASVKSRTGDAFAQLVRSEHRTIDSGDVFPRSMEPMGLIETDLDTEVTVITSGTHVKTRSLMNLGAEAPPRSLAAPPHPTRPHKSMEFLLDKQNLKVVEPPENELQKGEQRVMSEHQLRIQRSLQKLTIPDWYKQYQAPRENFILKKNIHRERWPGTSSKTPSLSSLGSSNHSPVLLSPTPNTQPFVRWSTSKLNSTASSPCASTRSSFNTRQPNGSISPSSIRSSFNYRQPYLGWRSQERLTKPRTPAERLACSLLIQNQNQPIIQPESPEIQTSIKEVTSAIVHYVSGLKPELSTSTDNNAKSRSNSASPRGSQKLCWLESSFVGIRPLDAPETPVTLAENHTTTSPPSNLRLELHNDMSKSHVGYTKPSPSSTTLEDVLDSLLGLPPSTRAPSPSHQETASANTSPSHLGEASRAAEQFRRHSEGSEPLPHPPTVQRRVSFHSSPVLRCRYSRCSKVVSTASKEARAFKNCHNCSYIYCSKACRRAHWEKHRKSCLFSRVGTLCRQVLAASKEQNDTLLQISLIARRGFLSHGQGAVKCFFPCPEAAEKFLIGGLSFLGELTYVRWTDLLPTEMGPQMYAELVKMCKNYNPDTKLVLYVTVCVVSEVPATGAVKWERQLVSRCAKMRLSKEIPIPERDITENLETLVLTCSPTRDIKSREYVFSNIQNQLKMRGVSLRRQYPEIYQQLCVYVEGKCSKFTPVTVYPKDDITGKSFMCIIMLDSDPEGVRQVSAAGIPVNTINLLHNWSL
ncbi:hypothetical protein RN001_005079 [Aquatica leii]|uniref:Apical junction molecule ajm1 alpha/beta domain-containing protein n=1 Tax=Aquatica leii TaxID=1421715 RepID=A0AAN7SS00_9COLE|nr:hypothetical protein RN001_005079 [Aquatica leii]